MDSSIESCNMGEQMEADKMSKSTHSDTKDDAVASDQALLARRRLLKLGAYVPPAILGMAILGSMPSAAYATIGSCSPSACQPCLDASKGIGGIPAKNQCKKAQAQHGGKGGGS
jgi:hypothetical protein